MERKWCYSKKDSDSVNEMLSTSLYSAFDNLGIHSPSAEGLCISVRYEVGRVFYYVYGKGTKNQCIGSLYEDQGRYYAYGKEVSSFQQGVDVLLERFKKRKSERKDKIDVS